MSILAKHKIEAAIAAEDKNLAALSAAKRSLACRIAVFKEFFDIPASDITPESKAKLEAKIANAESEESKTDFAIEMSKAKLEALNDVLQLIDLPPVVKVTSIPPRRPGWSYAHKDLREGTDIYRVRELLRKNGKPTPLHEIVTELFGSGELDFKQGKYANLRGTITGYANENRVFTIESKSPHIIGLVEFKDASGGIVPTGPEN